MKKTIRLLVELFLTFCAKLVLRRHKPIIIAITGSAGKTTTKTVIGSVLGAAVGEANVLVAYGNLGSVAGIPLALLSINVNILDVPYGLGGVFLLLLLPLALLKTLWTIIWPWYPRYLVLEVGADRPGDIKFIASYLKPLIVVVTNVGPAHLEIFKTVEGVAREKGSLVQSVREDGLVILYAKDPLVKKMAENSKARTEYIFSSSSLFAAEAARAIGNWLGISTRTIDQGLKNLKLPPRRFDILRGIKDTIIIDSTYNANPTSVKSALERMLEVADPKGRKIVVLGDMLELGQKSENYHKEIGQLAHELSDYLVAIGPLSQVMPADFSTLSASEALSHILSILKPSDTILVKASHGMHLETIVKGLEKK